MKSSTMVPVTQAMKWMPAYKLASTSVRALVFMFVMISSEVSVGSINLLSFVSIVTVAGIAIGFGSQDSLLGSNDASFARYKRLSVTALITLVGLSPILFLDNLMLNNFFAALSFGATFWALGEIRSYSVIYYEVILSSHMALLWSLYLILLPYESQNFYMLSLLFLITGSIVFSFALILRVKARGYRSTVEGGFSKIALSKLTWEVSYSALTRSPFIFWVSFTVLPSIFSYLYYFCELLSVIISHFQSRFMISGQGFNQTRLYFKLMRFLSFGYLLALLGVICIFLFQHELLKLITAYERIYSVASPILTMNKVDLVLCIVCCGTILVMQWIAYARYAFKLHANANVSFAFFGVLLLNVSLIYFYFGPLGKEALVLFAFILLMVVIFGLLLLIRKNKNIISSL